MPFLSISPELYAWVILPLLIFIARVCDVSMETVRIIFISRGIRVLAAVVAFFEIIIWLLAIVVVMNDLTNIANFLAFALGFAMGTYVGIIVEDRLAIGMVILRVITVDGESDAIKSYLMSENHGVTMVDAQGSRGCVRMILALVNRSELPRITAHLETINPCAFYSVEDVRYVNEGVFCAQKTGSISGIVHSLSRRGRKK